jgi:hypothetical protein
MVSSLTTMPQMKQRKFPRSLLLKLQANTNRPRPYIPRAVLNELWSDANCNILADKSFADDLNLERGIVNSREALLPRAIEIHPQFFDLFFGQTV